MAGAGMGRGWMHKRKKESSSTLSAIVAEILTKRLVKRSSTKGKVWAEDALPKFTGNLRLERQFH